MSDLVEYKDRFNDILIVDSSILDTPQGVEVSFEMNGENVVLLRPQIVDLVAQLQVYLEKTQ